MHKFLYGVVLFGILCLGIGVLGSLWPPSPGATVDPTTARLTACYDKYERLLRPTTDADKGDLMAWCIRDVNGLNR